jgi:fibronectin type 3 domain-containing protein
VATATAYNIYRSTTTGAETLLAFNVTGTGYVDNNVLAGGRYFYKVSAVNAGGEGPLSAEVSAIPTVARPAAPTVTATGQQKNIKLSWDAVPGATAYRIYRSLSSGAEVLYVTLNGTNYVDKLVQSPFTYYYQVTAYNAAGESLRSTEVFATPLR